MDELAERLVSARSAFVALGDWNSESHQDWSPYVMNKICRLLDPPEATGKPTHFGKKGDWNRRIDYGVTLQHFTPKGCVQVIVPSDESDHSVVGYQVAVKAAGSFSRLKAPRQLRDDGVKITDADFELLQGVLGNI